MHSLCLLDIKKSLKEEKLMKPKEALELLERIALKRKEKWIFNAKMIVLSCITGKKQEIAFGNLKALKKQEFCVPASIIVCSELSEKEKEAVKALCKEIK